MKVVLTLLILLSIIIPDLSVAARKIRPRKSSRSSSAASFNDPTLFRIQGSYGIANFDPTEIETFRKQVLWNATTASEGDFDKMTQTDIGLGLRIGWGHLMVHSFSAKQDLKNTDISGTSASVKDSFDYAATYLFYDVPFIFNNLIVTAGLGIGKAHRFDFHQKISGGTMTDVTWSDRPMGYRARASVGYLYSNSIGLFLEMGYEMMKSTLTASSDYPNITIGGNPIMSGQKLVKNSSAVEADISGGRFGAGLILIF